MSKIDLYGLITIAGAIIFGIGAIGMVCNKRKPYISDNRKSNINLVNDGGTRCQVKQVKANGHLPAHGIITGSDNTYFSYTQAE